MDWCAFHIVTEDGQHEKSPHDLQPKEQRGQEIWDALDRFEVPQRTYIDEIAFVIAIPGVILAVLVAILSVLLCFQHEKLQVTFFMLSPQILL